MNQTEPYGTRNWVLYDAQCGVCRKWVPFWEKTLNRAGFQIAPLQEEWVRSRFGMEEPELLADLRVLLKSGESFSGPDAYRSVMKRIWWAYPLYLLTLVPGFRWVFENAYRKFADNRHRISKACSAE